MTELVVISGKGGTGKTSLVASLAVLFGNAVVADCDVDAADLHIVLSPQVIERHPFSGGKRARIRPEHCTGCGACEEVCRFDAISSEGRGNGTIDRTFRVDPLACEGCGVCTWFCPQRAIQFGPVKNGEWFVSDTRCGPMVHAQLDIAQANSGKLVSTVRSAARRVAEERGIDLVIVDGSPGIGCPVIASITGAQMVLVVSEPTLSGLHDLERVAALTTHFGMPTLVCVNKWDLNAEVCSRIEEWATRKGLGLAGRIRYAASVTAAQVNGKSVVEYEACGCSDDLRAVWQTVGRCLEKTGPALAGSPTETNAFRILNATSDGPVDPS